MKRELSHLLDAVSAAGALDDAGLREASSRVDRGLFIPESIWVAEPGGYHPLSRDNDEAAWLAEVYSDEPVVTQVDGRIATSSASMPSLVFMMLRHLDLADGMRVLEAGAGTGYNAALLSFLVGEANVTTVETDPSLSAAASQALERAGFHPHVINGDGSLGYPPNAPYDRIIGTYAVQTVPYAWVEQCRSGGVIVTPWGTPFDNSALLRLTVEDDHTATGRFVEAVAFMWDRGQQPDDAYIVEIALDEHDPDESVTAFDPRQVLIDEHATFTIGLRVPDCREVTVFAPDDTGRFTLWVLALDRASWASVSFEPTDTEWEVEQYGPRRLWDEVEAAYHWWGDAGRPERERYGVTITPAGQRSGSTSPPGDRWRRKAAQATTSRQRSPGAER